MFLCSHSVICEEIDTESHNKRDHILCKNKQSNHHFPGAPSQKSTPNGKFRAYLKDAYLRGAHLEEAKLRGARMEGAYLPEAHLQGADLRNTFFDNASNLERITLNEEKHGCALLADVQWGSVNLSVVNWLQLKILGDEYKACQRERSIPVRTAREKGKLLEDYHEAVRAYRQLANAMRAQGMNEEAVPLPSDFLEGEKRPVIGGEGKYR